MVVSAQLWFGIICHLTLEPPPPLPFLLSNQATLICYKRGPSGPYYTNPCDVIPNMAPSTVGHAALHLTADGHASSLCLPGFPRQQSGCKVAQRYRPV